MKKTNVLLAGSLLISHALLAQFSAIKMPLAPGVRKATATVNLNGLSTSQAKVSVVYGTDSMAVVNAFIMQRRDPSKYFESPASLSNGANGTANATVIFPHKNKAAGRREKLFNPGTKIFYSWARTNTPAGASSELTLNSPVKSFTMPRPLTIAYLGDSYASGEGAKGQAWLNEACHRSANSGGELAIRKFRSERTDIELDYINTTCSGARLLDFFAVAQPVEPGKTPVKQGIQVDLVVSWLNRNNYDGLDIVLADGGGNDVGFANVVSAGLLSFFKEVRQDAQLMGDVRRELNRLPETYSMFKNYLESKVEVGRVIWFNYPNPMTGNPLGNGRYDANICKQDNVRAVNPLDCWGPLENQMSNADWQFVHDNIFLALNQRVSEAAAAHGWDFVNVANRALRNGICNCEGYFNTVGQSLFLQGDQNGTMHPNIAGFREIYRDPIYNQLNSSVDRFHTDYIADARARAIEAAKQRARAAAAFKAKMNQLTQIVSDQSKLSNRIVGLKLLKPQPALTPKTLKQ